MVIYKYVGQYLPKDLSEKNFCQKHKIVYFKPTVTRKKWLEKWVKTAVLPVIDCHPDVICYWRYFGTWGMYDREDNSISICPYKIERAGGLVKVIKHELLHLQHPEADNMEHDEKEVYIENLR